MFDTLTALAIGLLASVGCYLALYAASCIQLVLSF